MSNERYVAAIEVSSSKIMAVVGKMLSDGRLEVIATEQEKGVESVRYGLIQNLEETSIRVSRILERLQRRPAIAPRQITGLFVGLSGRSLRSISTEVQISLPSDTEIDDQILERLRNQALATAIDSSLSVVDAIPRTYIVDKYETVSPKGTIGNSIRATYDLVVCRPEMRRNLVRTLTEKTGISINGFVVTALATSQTVLSSEEKRQGCMLIDMGAETTTVSIYKEGHLVYFATLPMGGRNITRDLTSCNLLEEKAEDIKISSGNAIQRDTPSTVNLGGAKMSDVANIVVARSEEIVANIIEQISYAGLKESDLPGGIICIGGASKLNGMLDLMAAKTGLPVHRGMLPNYISIEDSRAPLTDVVEAASILYAGASNSDVECLVVPESETLPGGGTANREQITERGTEDGGEPRPRKPRKPNWMDGIRNRLADMFGGSNEDDSDLLE